MAPTDIFYDEKGRRIGRDENGDNGKVRIVTDKKEISTIKDNEKAGTYTASGTITSGVSTTKIVIGEALNVLDRTNANGGTKEEISNVTSDGTITRAESGSNEVKGADEYGEGGYVESQSLPIPKGEGNTRIHSHPTAIIGDPQNGVKTGDARVPGPGDPDTFKSFSLNIIVGNLGEPTINTESGTGKKTMYKPDQGAVFYDSKGKPIVELKENALRKILK